MKAIGKSSDTRRGTKEAGKVRIRRKIDPLSPPTTLELRGIRIHFPFKPYACQEAYMEKVLDALFRSENALLESPTGTGKTLMLLCATLAWQRQQQRSLREAADLPASSEQGGGGGGDNAVLGPQDGPAQAARLPQIIYASRTHSQLSQVVRELRNTRYRPPHAVLASREQMCVNPKVKKAHSTASDINHDCNKLGKERKCRYRNGLEGFVPPPSEHGGGSPNHQPVMDMEELNDMGKAHHVCPFYYTRSHVENAELILVPYNYLFDKDARETTLSDVRWQNAVIIFDEAHNLESFASDSASFDLSNIDIAGCMNEVQRAANYLSSMPDLQYNIKEDNLALLTRAFEALESFIMGLGPPTAYSGEFMMEIFRKGAGITHGNHSLFIEELRKVNDMIMDLRGTGATRGSPRLEHFVSCLKRVFGHKHEARCLAKASSYRVHVSPKVNGEAKKAGRTISYWCFAPSVAMEELSNLNVRSIIVTSGTLSPLPSYSMELGIPFPHTLENPHIIQRDQVHVRVIGKGVSGKFLSSSYERRQDGEYYSELGSTLASLSKVVPAGMLVFFPSYGVMETCIERWGGPSMSRPSKPQGRNAFFAQRKKASASKQYAFPRIAPAYNTAAFGNSASSPWKRMVGSKAVVVEPRSSADLPDAIAEFKRFLEMPKSSGCILMGVCRGKISEGIDFAHDMSRAVIITGIPFAPAFDAKVKMKREFLDCARTAAARKPAADAGFGDYIDGHNNESEAVSSKLSGSEWYLQQAHRAVNQAVGRVIRNKSDYGAILLLDTRFDQPRNREGLSRWVRPHVQSDEGFGPAVKALGAFYRAASTQARIRAESRPAPVEVDYDESNSSDEDIIGDVKNVAIIRNDRPAEATAAEDIESIGDAYVAPSRVVARVSVDTYGVQAGRKEAVHKTNQKPGAAQNFDGVFRRSETTAPKKKTKTAASIFMEKTRSLMDMNRQSTIRKLIVLMKKQGDNKDIRGFRQSANGIIDLVLRAEKHESPPVENDERMLFLFLDLVPPAYRNDFELIALQKVVEMSVLGHQCKENFLPAECTRLFSDAVSALQLVWFRNDEQGIAFFQSTERVVSAICKAEKVASQTMLQSYLHLLPNNRHETCRRIFEEFEKTRKMEQWKEQQRNKVGESSIDVNRFLPASVVNKRSYGRLGGTRSEDITKPIGDFVPVSRPSVAPLEKRKVPVNPYKKMKTKVIPPKAVSKSAGSSRATSLSSILESIESETSAWHKKPPANSKGPAIKSNAPSNLTCFMCSTRMTRPYIAPCGHLACLGCWKDWLNRSQTCAACRVPTRMDSISLAVYQTTTKAADSSDGPSQRTEQKKGSNAGDDSDGELELY